MCTMIEDIWCYDVARKALIRYQRGVFGRTAGMNGRVHMRALGTAQ